jgi:4-hydroxysphinganine ceramide fatty acyl 2-hydroxylase
LRLVFPPPVGLTLFYFIKTYLFSHFGIYEDNITAGFVMGYIAYDLTHYFIHHNKPSIGYFKSVKDYHILHHYKNPHLGYGVSNKMWDYAFGTVLHDDSPKNPGLK